MAFASLLCLLLWLHLSSSQKLALAPSFPAPAKVLRVLISRQLEAALLVCVFMANSQLRCQVPGGGLRF